MASKIILKKSSVASKVPVAGDLEFGELAINYADSKLYFKKADGSIDAFSSAAASAPVSSVGGYTGAVTDSQLLAAIKNVDGSGSGLDADTLDGNHASAFYLASNPNGYTSNTGTVTSVGAIAPLVSSGGTDPSISIPAANATTNGYMSSAYAAKLDGIAAGATANTGTVTSVTGTGSYGGLSLSGTVTSSGNITLSGTPTGTWPISVSGNAATVTDGVYKTGTNAASANIIFNTTADNWLWQEQASGGNVWYSAPSTANFGIGANRYVISSSGASNQAELVLERGTTKLLEVLQANLQYKNNIVLHAGNYTSYSPSLTGSGASGTWGINITGNAATASNSTTVGGLVPSQFFNNMGNNHGTYTDFNNVPNFGAYYLQQGGNSPTGVAGQQWYGFTLGLGNEYALSSYGTQLYWPRAAQNSDTYIYVRDRENGSWGSWRKIRAGYADSAGTVSSIGNTQVTTMYSPNGATVVSPDATSAMPGLGQSFIHTLGTGPGGNDGHLLAMSWVNTTSVYGAQIFVDTDPTGTMALRQRSSGGVWTAWNTFLTSGNYNSYSPTLTGGGASGTWGINITGNAATVSSVSPSQLSPATDYTTPSDASGYTWIRFQFASGDSFNSGQHQIEFYVTRSINFNGNSPYGGCTAKFTAQGREWHSGQEMMVVQYGEHGTNSSGGQGYYISHARVADQAGGGYWVYLRVRSGITYRFRDAMHGGAGCDFGTLQGTTDPGSGQPVYAGLNLIATSVGANFYYNGNVALNAGNYTNYAVATTNNTSLNTDTRNTRGVTRLYRRDDNSDYSVQVNWTGGRWLLRGYNGDSFHAECEVGSLSANSSITTPTITGLREVRVAGATTFNLATGNYFSRTNSGATAFAVSNVPSSGTAVSFILDLTNGGSGAITWWSGVRWAGGTAPTLTASGRDVLGFFTHDGGTTWTGLLLGKDVK